MSNNAFTLNDYALLWSQRQQCFHVEQLHESLAINMRSLRAKRPMDYVLLAIDPDPDVLSQLMRRIDPRQPEAESAARTAREKAAA